MLLADNVLQLHNKGLGNDQLLQEVHLKGRRCGRGEFHHVLLLGYSSVRPVMRDGQEDRDAFRRVVFSATPNRKSLLEEIETDAVAASDQ
jgi:hypothetical protein